MSFEFAKKSKYKSSHDFESFGSYLAWKVFHSKIICTLALHIITMVPQALTNPSHAYMMGMKIPYLMFSALHLTAYLAFIYCFVRQQFDADTDYFRLTDKPQTLDHID